MPIESRRKKQIVVLSSVAILAALLYSALNRNYGTWTGNYCVGEPCQPSSPMLGYTGKLKREDASCPPVIEVQTSVSYVGGIFFPTNRYDFLNQGTCRIVVKPNK